MNNFTEDEKTKIREILAHYMFEINDDITRTNMTQHLNNIFPGYGFYCLYDYMDENDITIIHKNGSFKFSEMMTRD